MLQSAPPHLRHFIVHLENTMWCTSMPKGRRSLHGCRRCLGKELLLPSMALIGSARNGNQDFLRNINEFELINGVAEAIKKINASGYLAIVVTNQPVIARGEVTFQELEEIHNKMETELGLQGAYLDAIYYCPHHPHKGYEGEVPELKIECDCRKPKPGMLLKAAIDYNIDLSQSYMIGDGENDIKAGMAAGCKAILVNGNGTDTKNEDFGQVDTLSSVLEFVDKYLH